MLAALVLLFLPFLVSGRPATEERDILITVKTARKYYSKRLNDVLGTWYKDAPEDIFFITDKATPELIRQTNNHIIPTKCLSGHSRKQLSCKMDAEIELWRRKVAKWYCHFDDDNFVNIAKLRELLAGYDHRELWYLGKASTATPFSAMTDAGEEVDYWFGTGGAGICLSKAALEEVLNYLEDISFQVLSNDLGFPDDVTLGYIMSELAIPLTNSNLLHSHLEDLSTIKESDVAKQVSLSQSAGNVVSLHRRERSYMEDLYRLTHR